MATIRKARVAAMVTQRDLSARIGRSHNFIHKVELGERTLSFLEALDIAEALAVDPFDLLDQVLSYDYDKPAAKPYPIVVSAKKRPKRRT